MPQLENLISNIPDYAKDIKINLKTLLNEERSELNKNQIVATTYCCAIATKNQTLIKAVQERAENHLSSQELHAVKGAAIIMGMNNIYYRFLHLVSNKEYAEIPAGLRMQILSAHGINDGDFELYSLAVSSINGCGLCIDSHEKALKKHNVSTVKIQNAIKIAAAVNALGFVI
jgi:alkyl hydroperoxide reductase subunit D